MGSKVFVRADLVPGQKEWVELFTDDLEAVVGEALTATVLVDEVEIAVDSLHVMALAGRLPLREYARMETSLVLRQESVAVRLVVDFQPEPGHAYEYEDKFLRVGLSKITWFDARTPVGVSGRDTAFTQSVQHGGLRRWDEVSGWRRPDRAGTGQT